MQNAELLPIYTPDDLMTGRLPQGRVLIFDDDHYYLGGVLAERLVEQGCRVLLVTPAPLVSYWTKNTLEQGRIQTWLAKLGVQVYRQHTLDVIGPESVVVSDLISGSSAELVCEAVVLITDRISNDALYYELKSALSEGLLTHLSVIGDAQAPHLIAQAVYSGHLAARELDEKSGVEPPFRREFLESSDGTQPFS